ncbi:MAG: cytochrome c oxidase subunit 3 family protein [Betaproteobacteria bacterium]|nr:cytochrome c oxidase subunit 3 family protein [Betaproteobacteria bacterium]NCP82375.1 cytochrome c oxidase subunit 3 family protein [Rhodoferax sp.]NCS60173.1 cytochrome c oxidase subunit 3 family protein [Rhodoferax sp.]PJC15257.1 MAG: cytochrome-c oxidase [Comamonadaceae bacterium CG_4_9_14_0_8_um_filter_57_21]
MPTSMSQPNAVTEIPYLAGDLAVWLIILAELLTFGIFFLSYAFARTFDVALFNASQTTLDLNSGGINTALLITGSWCVVRAVQAVKRDASAVGVRWLMAALVCGSGFVVIKLIEFSAKADAGIDLSTNSFYMFYFLLTAFHFFHVLAAMVFLSILLFKTRAGRYGSHDVHELETGAAFWHMVDLLWIVLFPLIYVMR